MGRNVWNASAWHRQHSRRARIRTSAAVGFGRRMMGVALFAVLGLATGAAAVAAGVVESPEDGRVGICHATGSEDHPYVFIVAAKDSAEEAGHADHAGDIIGVDDESECAAAPTATADETPACVLDDAPAAAAPPAVDPETVGLCEADVSLLMAGTRSGNLFVFNFTVASLGPDEANQVRLQDDLPDVGRTWRLGGPDAGRCTLVTRNLSCDFGDLTPNAERKVWVSALRCPSDCGDDLQDTATVSAFNDGQAENNLGTAAVVIPDCGATAPPPTSAAPAPASPAPSQPNTTNGSSNDSSQEPPAANSTEPAPGGNDSSASPNATPPAPAGNESSASPNETPAAAPQSDVAIVQRGVQDDERITLTLTVVNRGAGTARNLTLADTLPDLRRPWYLSGTDAGSCTLEGRELACAFDDLAGGENRTLYVSAYTDRMPCGQHLVNTATVAATDDANATNNRSSQGIEARAC